MGPHLSERRHVSRQCLHCVRDSVGPARSTTHAWLQRWGSQGDHHRQFCGELVCAIVCLVQQVVDRWAEWLAGMHAGGPSARYLLHLLPDYRTSYGAGDASGAGRADLRKAVCARCGALFPSMNNRGCWGKEGTGPTNLVCLEVAECAHGADYAQEHEKA
jgi:hypothetical protein